MKDAHMTPTQKMKFSIEDFFRKCDQIRSFLSIWSHLMKKSLMENFSFYAVVGANLVPIAVQFSEKNFDNHKEEIKS